MYCKRTLALFSVAVLIAGALGTTAGAGEIYRWTDEEGNIYYTDKPIGNSSERLDIQSRNTNQESVQAELASVQSLNDATAERNAAKAKQAETQEKAAEERREREEKCAMYQARLTRFNTNRRIYREDENGQRAYLDEDQMAQVRSDTRDKVTEYCGY